MFSKQIWLNTTGDVDLCFTQFYTLMYFFVWFRPIKSAHQPPNNNLVNLTLEAAYSSESLVHFLSYRGNSPEDHHLTNITCHKE